MGEDDLILDPMHFEEHYELFTSIDEFNQEYGYEDSLDVQRWLFEWRCW